MHPTCQMCNEKRYEVQGIKFYRLTFYICESCKLRRWLPLYNKEKDEFIESTKTKLRETYGIE